MKKAKEKNPTPKNNKRKFSFIISNPIFYPLTHLPTSQDGALYFWGKQTADSITGLPLQTEQYYYWNKATTENHLRKKEIPPKGTCFSCFYDSFLKSLHLPTSLLLFLHLKSKVFLSSYTLFPILYQIKNSRTGTGTHQNKGP